LLSILVVSSVLGSTRVLAAPDYVINTYDNAGSVACDYFWWGVGQFAWDSTQNHTGNSGGSLHLYGNYTSNSPDANLDMMSIMELLNCGVSDPPAVDLTRYRTVSFWIKWDSTSSIALADFNRPGGGLSFYFLDEPWWPESRIPARNSPFAIPGTASNNWVYMNCPIDELTALSDCKGISFFNYTPGAGGSFSFWIDDIVLHPLPCGDCAPPPFMFMQRANKGLNLLPASTGQYNRQNIRTAPNAGNFSWMGHGNDPVSYSFTVTNFNAVTTNFQVHMFLIPNAGTEINADWVEPAVVYVALQNKGNDNHAELSFRYRTSLPPGNLQFTNPPVIITNASVLGTWTVTFRNDTNVTMTTPGGASTNFNLPDDVESLNCFLDPLNVYFGIQPNETWNLGGSAVLSQVRIFDTANDITNVREDFSYGLDTNLWQVIAADPSGIQPVPANACWLLWTEPSSGYVLQTNSDLGNPAGWAGNGLPAPNTTSGGLKYTLLTPNPAFTAHPLAFPDNGSLFFRLRR
jgi:hypothetical protein